MAATSQNIIRTLTIKSTVEGADKTKADLKGIQSAHEQVARTTETSARGQLSLADSVSKAERRFNSALRSQQDFEKVQRQMNAAVAQNPALQARANEVLRLASEHFGKASAGQAAFSRGMQAANDNLQSFAMRAGPIGSVLASFGVAGVAAGAGIGAAVLALHQTISAVNALADRAGKMVDFAETTGLTTTQLQALQKAAAFVGIDIDKVGTGFERFSVQMEELRRGTGGLFDAMNRIDPALTNQLATTRDLGEAWDIFAGAIKRADRELGNAAAKAAFGRTGIPFTRLAGATVDAGGTAGLEAGLGRVNVLTTEQLKRWDELKDRIDYVSKTARDNVVSIFSDSTLSAQLKFYEGLLAISQVMKRISELGFRGAIRAAARAPEPTEPVDSFSSRFGVWSGGVKTREEFDVARMRQRVDILGSAASATMKLSLAEAELALKAKLAGVSQEDLARGISGLRLEHATAAMGKQIALLGDLAKVDDIVLQKQREINVAVKDGAKFTDTQIAAMLSKARVQAEAAGPDAQIRIQREALFLLEEEAQIRQQLLAWGVRWNSEEGERLAGQLRFNNALKEIKDISTAALSGFAKDIANGVKPMDAMVNQAKRLQDIFIDMAAKKIVNEAMGAAFGGVASATGQVAGATAAAGILTTAGAATGTEIATGAGVGAGLITAAGVAFWGPLAIFVGAIAFLASIIPGAEKERQRKAVQGYRDRATLAQTDTSTLQGSLSQFDMRAREERASLPNGGLTQKSWTNTLTLGLFGDKGGKQTQESIALDQALAAERLRIIEDFGKRAVEMEKQAEEKRLADIKAFEQARMALQDRLFAATNDTSTLEGAVAAQEREFARERLDELDAGGRLMADLLVAQYAERFQLEKSFHDKAVEAEEQAAQQRMDAINGAARGIVDYLNNLVSGPASTLSPQDALANAQTVYNANLALAQSGNIDAVNKFAQLADNLEKAARARFASSQGYQDIRNQIISQGLALPAVTQATDPVVVAIRDSIAAIHATTTAVGGTTTAVGGTTTAVGGTTGAVNVNNTLNDQIKDISAAMDISMRRLGDQEQQLFVGIGNTYFGPMVNYLKVIEENTRPSGDAAPSTPNPFTWWDPRTWFHDGGIVGRYAPGGIVGNGMWNVDSVRARYAGGGDIMLAGREGILTAPATAAIGGGSTIDFINRNQRLPSNVIPFPSSAGASPQRDNGEHFDRLAARIERAIAGAAVAEINSQREEIAALRAELAGLTRATAANKPPATRPGTKTASAGR